MNLDEELRTAFKEETRDWTTPPELKERILHQISSNQGGKRMKKWILLSVLAAALLIPTGAYAAYNYNNLADSIYGSQENISHIGGTQQKYDDLEAKLQNAKQKLTEDEFTTFNSLLKEMTVYNLSMADSEGNLHPEQLSAEEQESYKDLTTALEPLFTKLNEYESPNIDSDNSIFIDNEKAKEILSTEEYKQFDNVLLEMHELSQKSLDASGNYNKDLLSDAESAKVEQLSQTLQTYLDKIDLAKP